MTSLGERMGWEVPDPSVAVKRSGPTSSGLSALLERRILKKTTPLSIMPEAVIANGPEKTVIDSLPAAVTPGFSHPARSHTDPRRGRPAFNGIFTCWEEPSFLITSKSESWGAVPTMSDRAAASAGAL